MLLRTETTIIATETPIFASRMVRITAGRSASSPPLSAVVGDATVLVGNGAGSVCKGDGATGSAGVSWSHVGVLLSAIISVYCEEVSLWC